MSRSYARMRADRHLRDSARALVEADVQNLRNDLTAKSLTARAFSRVREGATEVYDEAIDVAVDNRGALAALIAALVLWFARNPLSALFGERDETDHEHDETAELAEQQGQPDR